MHGQLTRLLEVAERPNVEVRVLPLRRGAHAGLDGTFWLYEMPDPYPDLAYVDNLAGALYVEDDAAVDRFRQAYYQLSAAALDGKESAALIVAAGEGAVMSTTSGPGAVVPEELVNVSWHISSRSQSNDGECVEAGPRCATATTRAAR